MRNVMSSPNQERTGLFCFFDRGVPFQRQMQIVTIWRVPPYQSTGVDLLAVDITRTIW